jgi:molybdopterin/thiamine biosynthesis adenylyltransferase
MNDLELLRYSRHILLEEIGIEGQQRINDAHILIIGAGGLGCACAPYLAAAGVGSISIMDHDFVDLTNLQRQIMHTTDRVGDPKVTSAKKMLSALNPHTRIEAIQEKASLQTLNAILPKVDMVVDCTDNFKTRHLINKLCVHFKKPLIFGAAIQFDGQVCVFNHQDENAACYACIFPEEEGFAEVSCSTMGVFSPLVGIIGSIQAAQVLQMLTHSASPLIDKLLMWDARQSTMSQIKIKKVSSCKVCGGS